MFTSNLATWPGSFSIATRTRFYAVVPVSKLRSRPPFVAGEGSDTEYRGEADPCARDEYNDRKTADEEEKEKTDQSQQTTPTTPPNDPNGEYSTDYPSPVLALPAVLSDYCFMTLSLPRSFFEFFHLSALIYLHLPRCPQRCLQLLELTN